MTPDLQFGLQLTVVGMGTVFLLLAVLMTVLTLIGRLDRPAGGETVPPPLPDPAPESPPAPARPPVLQVLSGGQDLDADTLAAIAVAVITHRDVRRQQAAPVMRTHQPGSLQHASRWVTLGRALQNQTPPKR